MGRGGQYVRTRSARNTGAGRFRFRRGVETVGLTLLVKRAFWASACFLLAAAADAEDLPAGIKALTGGQPAIQAPALVRPEPLSQDEFSSLTQAIDAAQAGDVERDALILLHITGGGRARLAREGLLAPAVADVRMSLAGLRVEQPV